MQGFEVIFLEAAKLQKEVSGVEKFVLNTM